MVKLTLILSPDAVFAGGRLNASLILHNTSNQPALVSWAGLQLYGVFAVDRARISVSSGWSAPKPATTEEDLLAAADVKGDVFFQSSVHIVDRDIALEAGEKVTFVYQHAVPGDLPPSFRGSGVRYVYALIAAAKETGAPTAVRQRVLICNPHAAFGAVQLKRINPHAQQASWRHDQAARMLPATTPRLERALTDAAWKCNEQASRMYNIRTDEKLVGRFVLTQSAFHVGDTVEGTIDFSNAELKCHQVAAVLEMHEVVAPALVTSAMRRVVEYDQLHDLTANALTTHMTLHIPRDAPATFQTDIVEVKWLLRIDFVVAKTTADPAAIVSERTASYTTPVTASRLHTLHWELPVEIFVSTSPAPLLRPDSVDIDLRT